MLYKYLLKVFFLLHQFDKIRSLCYNIQAKEGVIGMNLSIRRLVISIVIVCSILIVSIPFWGYSQSSKISVLADARTELPFISKLGAFEQLAIIDDSKAMETVTPAELIVRNRNGYEKTGKIYFLVEKSSTISYEYLIVSLNNRIYKLKDIELEEDEEYYYFYLGDIKLDAYTEESMMVRIWLSKDTKDIKSGSKLITNINVR